MREIKVRGKRVDNGEWVYGGIFGSQIIVSVDGWWANGKKKSIDKLEDYNVDPETVGQFTGMKDKNGVEIYEGDVVLKPTGTASRIDSKIVGVSNEYHVYKPSEPEQCIVRNVGYAFTLGTEEYIKHYGVLNNGSNLMAYSLEVIGTIHEEKP